MYHIRQGFTGEKWQNMINFTARPLEVLFYQVVLRVKQCDIVQSYRFDLTMIPRPPRLCMQPSSSVLLLLCYIYLHVCDWWPTVDSTTRGMSTLHTVKGKSFAYKWSTKQPPVVPHVQFHDYNWLKKGWMKSVCFCRKCFWHDNIRTYFCRYYYWLSVLMHSWISYHAPLPSLLSLSLRLTGARDPLQRHCSRIHLWSQPLHLIVHEQVSAAVVAARPFLLWNSRQSLLQIAEGIILWLLQHNIILAQYMFYACIRTYVYEVCASIVATILLLYPPNQHVALLDMSVTHAGVHLLASSCSLGTKNMNDMSKRLKRPQPYKPPTSPPSE